MSPAILLAGLRARGVIVAVDGEVLRVRGNLAPGEHEAITAAKPALMSILRREATVGLLPCGHRLGPGETLLGHNLREAALLGDDAAIARIHSEQATAPLKSEAT
jgi:hypothetical protein